jgi:nucleobase:cation symporter-1, NCS1 family
LAAYGAHGLSSKYENFLLLVSYWIGPWLGIVLMDFFLHRREGSARSLPGRAMCWPGIVAFLVGLVASIPFMNSALYTGPLARRLAGADIAYYIGLAIAAVVYVALTWPAGSRAETAPTS